MKTKPWIAVPVGWKSESWIWIPAYGSSLLLWKVILPPAALHLKANQEAHRLHCQMQLADPGYQKYTKVCHENGAAPLET